MATLDDLLQDDEDEAFENSDAAKAMLSQLTGAPPPQNGMVAHGVAAGVPAGQQYGVPHPGYYVRPPPHMQGMHVPPPQAQMVRMGHPQAHMYPPQSVPVQGTPARQQYPGGLGPQHSGGVGQLAPASRQQGGAQSQQRGGGGQQRGPAQQGGEGQQPGSREGQRVQLQAQVLAQLRTMRREDVQAKGLAARKVIRDAQEKQKSGAPVSDQENKQYQQARIWYQACMQLQQEQQLQKTAAAAAPRPPSSGTSMIEFLAKRLSPTGIEHFKRLYQAQKAGGLEKGRFQSELEKLCGPKLWQEVVPYFKGRSSSNPSSQPPTSSQTPQLARQGPLPPGMNQGMPSIPHPQSRHQATPPQQAPPAQQAFNPQQAIPSPDAPNLSPAAESGSSMSQVESAPQAEAKLTRIGTTVLRNAFVTASTKHPPKPSPPLPQVTREAGPGTREASPAVDANSDGESPERGGSAEPKTAPPDGEETAEEKKRRQKREQNRKTTEKRRKAREEKERQKLLEENGGKPLEDSQKGDDSQKGESPPKGGSQAPPVAVPETKDEEGGGMASPGSSSEDRPIGAGFGGSTANLAGLAKGGTPPTGAKAGSVPPKKPAAKNKGKKTTPPADAPKKAPKAKGKRPPAAQPPASAPAPSPELLAIKTEIQEHTAANSPKGPPNSSAPPQQPPSSAPQFQPPVSTAPPNPTSSLQSQPTANGPSGQQAANPGTPAQPAATSVPPPQPTIVTPSGIATGVTTVAIGSETGAQKGKGRGQGKKGVKRPGEDAPIGQGKAKKAKTDAAPAQAPPLQAAPIQTVQYNQWSAANPNAPLPPGIVASAPPLGGVLTAPPLTPAVGGVKRPAGAAGAGQPAQKKQQQREDDVTRLQDVTAVAGLDLEQEAQHSMALAGPIGDSFANEEARLRIAEEEDRLFANEAVLRARVSGVATKKGIERVGEDVYKCLSMAVEDRLRGMLHRLVKLAKQRTDIRKGRFFTYTHYNTREEVLKIRAREEAVFGARAAREEEKLRQMLAKKNKGPLTDPELEKRRQDALKLKEKDEEKRRAEAAMSTAMAALGKSSLARFTANYGKGVAKGPAGPSSKPPSAAAPRPSNPSPSLAPPASATPGLPGTTSGLPGSNPPAPGVTPSNPGLIASASGLPATVSSLPSSASGQIQPASEVPAIDPAVRGVNQGLPPSNSGLTPPNPIPASEAPPGGVQRAVSVSPGQLVAGPTPPVFVQPAENLLQTGILSTPAIGPPLNPPANVDEGATTQAMDSTKQGADAPALVTPLSAATTEASTLRGATFSTTVNPPEVTTLGTSNPPADATPPVPAETQPTNAAMETASVPQPDSNTATAFDQLPTATPPAVPSTAPMLPGIEAPLLNGASEAQSADPSGAHSASASGSLLAAPSETVPLVPPDNSPAAALETASADPSKAAPVLLTVVPSAVPAELPPLVQSDISPGAASLSPALDGAAADKQAPEPPAPMPVATSSPATALGEIETAPLEGPEGAPASVPTDGPSTGEKIQPGGESARNEGTETGLPDGPVSRDGEPYSGGVENLVDLLSGEAMGAAKGGKGTMGVGLVMGESAGETVEVENGGAKQSAAVASLSGGLQNGLEAGVDPRGVLSDDAEAKEGAVSTAEDGWLTDPQGNNAAAGATGEGKGTGEAGVGGAKVEGGTEQARGTEVKMGAEQETKAEQGGAGRANANAMDVDAKPLGAGANTSAADVSKEGEAVLDRAGELPGAEGAAEVRPPEEVEFPEGSIDLDVDEEMWEAGEDAPVSGGVEMEKELAAVGGAKRSDSYAAQNGLGKVGGAAAEVLHNGERGSSREHLAADGSGGGQANGNFGSHENGASDINGDGLAKTGVKPVLANGVNSAAGAGETAPEAMDVDGDGEGDLLAGPRLAPLKRSGQKQKVFDIPNLPGSDVRASKAPDRGTKRSAPDPSTEPPIDPALQPQSFSLARRKVTSVFPPSRGAPSQQPRSVTLKDLVALLEKEPQMAKSAVLYKLYCRAQREPGRGTAVLR